MDETDRRLVAALQSGLGGSLTPWADAASSLGLATDELIRRLERMREAGVLRSVRAILDQRALGLAGNVLVAWAVPEERVDEVGALFARRNEVSHCVLRELSPRWPYNLYTMIHAATDERAAEVVREMEAGSGVREHVSLVTVHELKKSPPRYV